jgi:hypothetical protein
MPQQQNSHQLECLIVVVNVRNVDPADGLMLMIFESKEHSQGVSSEPCLEFTRLLAQA